MPTSISKTHQADRAPLPATELAALIRQRAIAEGFDDVAITRPDAIAGAGAELEKFIAQNRHGDMDWLEAKLDRRVHPKALWPDVKSVIVLAMNYGPSEDPMAKLERTREGVISCYAQGRDYHDVLKKRGKRLARWLAESQGAQVKIFVDTAPVMEKPLAQAAGLGWQGKHTNLVSRRFGSWLFLAEIYTDLDLPADQPHEENCGACRRCIDICPTRAITAPYKLDARRCISYLTIEHKGHIAVEFRAAMGNRIFGCDDCLAICPWNKFAQTTNEPALAPRDALRSPRLAALAALDDAGFRKLFTASPVKRLGHARFGRNLLIAIGNSGDPALAAVAKARLGDGSPLVRAMAVWALGRLLPPEEFAALAAEQSADPDPQVRQEWARGQA